MDYGNLVISGLFGAIGYIAAIKIIFMHKWRRAPRLIRAAQIAACLTYLAYALRSPSPEALDEMFHDWRDAYYLICFLGIAFAFISAIAGVVTSIAAEDLGPKLRRWWSNPISQTVRDYALICLHAVIVLGTFVYMLFFNGFEYTWTNWGFHVGYSFLISQIWPLYWGWHLLATEAGQIVFGLASLAGVAATMWLVIFGQNRNR